MKTDRREFLRGCLVALGFAVAPAAIVTSDRPKKWVTQGDADPTRWPRGGPSGPLPYRMRDVRILEGSVVREPINERCVITFPCSNELLEAPLEDIEAEMRSNLIRDLGRALDKEILG